MIRLAAAFSFAALLLLVACAAPVVSQASLSLFVSGLPAGVDADVSVSGPDGFAQDLTASSILSVAPGGYTVSASSVDVGSVRYAPTVTGSPAELGSGASAEIEVAYRPEAGSLEVTISGLPAGLDADVVIGGPNGFSESLTSSTLLVDLVPGEYTLTISQVRSSDPIVSHLYDPTDSVPTVFEVMSGGNTVGTSYALQSSSGRLWTPHDTTTIVTGFAAADLVTTGAPTPAATLTGTSVSHEGIAFDGEGNAWITNRTTDTLERYDAADLASDRSPSPSVTIGGLNFPIGLAFDASGNLFIANYLNNEIVVFTPDQLLSSGSPAPSVTISDSGGSLNRPVGVAFDASGALWVTTFSGDTVVRFGASQLLSSGSPVPEVTIDDGDEVGGNLDNPIGVAFDAAGDLWVTNNGSSAILKFEDPGSLSGLVIPTPDVVLTGVTNPAGLVFDNSGSLWLVISSSGDLVRFDDPGSLSGAVSPVADAVVDGAASIDWGLIALYPPPVGLPITTP